MEYFQYTPGSGPGAGQFAQPAHALPQHPNPTNSMLPFFVLQSGMDLDPLGGEAAASSAADGSSGSGSGNGSTVGLAVGLTLGLLALFGGLGAFAYFKWWRPRRRTGAADAAAAAEQQAGDAPAEVGDGSGGESGGEGEGATKTPMTALKRFKQYLSHSDTASQVGRLHSCLRGTSVGRQLPDWGGWGGAVPCCGARCCCEAATCSNAAWTSSFNSPNAGFRVFSRSFDCVVPSAVAHAIQPACCLRHGSSGMCRQACLSFSLLESPWPQHGSFLHALIVYLNHVHF